MNINHLQFMNVIKIICSMQPLHNYTNYYYHGS